MSEVPRIALVGSPNAGKTTLFNALTGRRARVGNYPGVTVDHVEGDAQLGPERWATLIDLPGLYSLEPLSLDEEVTLQVLDGEMEQVGRPDGVAVVLDATTLARSLPLLGEIIARGLPTLLILTMVDELKARHGAVKVPILKRLLGIPVVGVVGTSGLGLDDLRQELQEPSGWRRASAETRAAIEEDRWSWGDRLYEEAVTPPTEQDRWTTRADDVLLHPVWGLLVFVLVMTVFFQIIFAGAAPLQDGLEWLVVEGLGGLVRQALPGGWVESLVVDGVIAGVGGVLVFVPQIVLILIMINVLEGIGYMSRAAFLIDRVMGWAGLEGRCFVALLSSYACAVPGIMATRTIPDPRSRLATILVAPFMTCSARLPVYALLIAAFVPATTVFGVFNLQGLTLLGLYILGSGAALLAAALFKRGMLRGRTYPFYMELPPYRVPRVKVIAAQVWRGLKAFLRKAGTVILAASLALWVLLSFPSPDPPPEMIPDTPAAVSWQLEQSYAAQVGKAVEPVFEPLGYDWKINVGLIASLAAREVVVSTLSQIYAFTGDEEDVKGLAERLRDERGPDGEPVYTLAVALSLMVFFVFSLQCVSTLAVIRRETHSWRWPAFAFAYMFAVAWVASFITYQLATWLGA